MQFLLTNNLGGYFWYTQRPLSRYQGWFTVLGGNMIKGIDMIEGAGLCVDMPPFSNALVIENNVGKPLTITLDIRQSYETPERNRQYIIEERDDILWIRYSLEPIMMGIAGANPYSLSGTWIFRSYPFDSKRSSPPFSLWVYQLLTSQSKRMIVAMGENEDDVRKTLRGARGYKLVSRRPLVNAYQEAKRSLLSLRVYTSQKQLQGVYAGLPWFFQFWKRDTGVAAQALSLVDESEARALLTGSAFAPSCGIDGDLWLMSRAKELGLLISWQEYANDDFITNGPKETWMDSIARAGIRIELQALKLAIMKGTPYEHSFAAKVKQTFFVKGVLVDGFEPDGSADTTKRPNIFLAAYCYPQLFSPREWEYIFDDHLQSLWLRWGGLASLDKNDVNFQSLHTGQNSLSYHQGDSWFWINNIAALVLHRAHSKKYEPYIKKIVDASSQDILIKGIPGHASELSSAGMFTPAGSPAQLWSAATFIELYQELSR